MSDEDVFGQNFLRTGRLSPHVGVTDQWLRVWRLLIGKSSGGSDFAVLTSEIATGAEPARHTYAAGLRITFEITLETAQTPNTAEISIYNLRDDFAKNLIKEGEYVTLEVGYEWGNVGAIFVGTVKMFKWSHETNVDSKLTIYAGDGDLAYINAVNNDTIEKDTEAKDELPVMSDKFVEHGVEVGFVDPKSLTQPPRIREHVIYGQTAEQMRDFAQSNGAIWDILYQRFNFQGPKSYAPGAVINLNAATGLVGFPEVTPDGITVTALINPAIRLRHRIMLNNKYINQYFRPGGISGGEYMMGMAEHTFAPLSDAQLGRDGMYTPITINYSGDSRSGVWYMTMVCLAVNVGTDPDNPMSVLNSVFGGDFRMF